ncbi:Lyso-phosphatidylcholine acyltransferase [Lithohypha guttulata]|uniref:Tafazzin family protein n=1 Tax=Lithohypha guttulata TaxID=1690604 RepID=A0AAN7STA0_9EURO|nr:Lyso-phosphatidylcholine acyltransferase [Lithohypha guttulata]
MVLIDDLTNHLYKNTEYPSFLWRSGSYSVLLSIHAICRAALYGLNKTEVHGLPRFLDLLKARADYKTRTRGLLTVSNHISVIDDPVIWGVLPLSFAAFYGYQSHRWSFASHDLCFTNTPLSHFFSLGQCFPTHRIKHSKHGGLFQPTFTEAIRMLSRTDNPKADSAIVKRSGHLSWPRNAIDPLSSLQPPPAFPSQPYDVRAYNAPSRYAVNSYSWVHIFPEGFIHQTDPSERNVRYFKWGVSRLILEPVECPDIVPMFIEGTDRIMHESRTFPRFIPRMFNKVVVSFGDEVDVEDVFGDLRKRWRELCDKENEKLLQELKHEPRPSAQSYYNIRGRDLHVEEHRQRLLDQLYKQQLGVVSEKLKCDPEVVEMRKECTKRVRDLVLNVRRGRGYPDEDPKSGIAETWKLEGPKREGQMEDDSWVKET